MASKRIFTTMPVRALGDQRFTALTFRSLGVIALHDGMSKVKGSGGGCYARHATLAERIGTDVTNFSKSLSLLIKWGYVAREPQLMDKRRFTLRVIYSDEDSWQPDQPSPPQELRDPSEIVGEEGHPEAEIVGEAEGKNGSFSRENDAHYISLNEELDFDESREINSPKGPRFAQHSDNDVLDSIFASGRFSSERPPKKKDPAEAGCGEWALKPHLPSNLSKLPLGAQVSRIEAAFDAIGRDADRMARDERSMFAELLYNIGDEYSGGELDAVAQQANRLWEEMAPY
jgi:DNA-binding MarR family transcriptional regulator